MSQSHLEGSFGEVQIITVQDDALGVVQHIHVDDSAPSEGHIVEVRAKGEVIAERTNAMRQPKLGPWKQFAIGGDRVDCLLGSGIVWSTTTCLQ